MRPALFLDRDGVINIEKNYLYKIEDFEFVDGIIELCQAFSKQGYYIFVVTNQSGIARKYYTEKQFNILSTWMINEFKKYDVVIQKVYHCPHHPSITGECTCRKPNPGMIEKACLEFDIDTKNSVLVGDKESDIGAARAAGITTSYLFSSTITSSNATKIITSLKELLV